MGCLGCWSSVNSTGEASTSGAVHFLRPCFREWRLRSTPIAGARSSIDPLSNPIPIRNIPLSRSLLSSRKDEHAEAVKEVGFQPVKVDLAHASAIKSCIKEHGGEHIRA